MVVAWRSGSQQGVSRLGTMALGGLFLHTANPPSNGSMLEVLFDIAIGSQVRARAVVRNSVPGKGMGVKFVHMQAEDRSRLNKFLKTQLEAGNIQEDLTAEQPKPESEKGAVQSNGARATETEAPKVVPAAPLPPETVEVGGQPAADSVQTSPSEPIQAEEALSEDDSVVSEEELARYLALSEKSNHYQLLGVTSDAGYRDIKRGFYALARKFHPDRHMAHPEWVKPLQQLMGAITEAYNILSDETKRGNYDRKLMHHQTEAQETIEECVKLAANAQRDENREGAIFWMRKCVAMAPDVAKYRVSLASSLALLPHHRREAVEQFQRAIQLDYWNTEAYLQCGELYEKMQLPWRAATLYSKILEFDTGHVLARHGLARTEGKEKRKKGAPRLARLFSNK
jgi:curved DNA-binding protein CbpA